MKEEGERAQTRWLLVWALVFAGVVAAFQIGKAPIAIPLLRQDLGLSLTFASFVIGAYAIVGAVAGLPGGLLINFVGARRSTVIGLVVIGAASCAGAFATSGAWLLLTRALEGAGFLMVAIATPTLLSLVTAPKDRDIAFGFWAVYFATGSVIVMLAGPLLAAFGWRALWLATGVLSLGYALVVWWVAPVVRRPRASDPGKLAGIGRILRSPGPILLALAFGFYSLQYHALSGLLPTLLVEQLEALGGGCGRAQRHYHHRQRPGRGVGWIPVAERHGALGDDRRRLWLHGRGGIRHFQAGHAGCRRCRMRDSEFGDHRHARSIDLCSRAALCASDMAPCAHRRHRGASQPSWPRARAAGLGDMGRELRLVERALLVCRYCGCRDRSRVRHSPPLAPGHVGAPVTA